MMNNVSNNKPTGYKVYKHNDKAKEETSKSIVYRQYWHIRFTFISVANAVINCSGEGKKQFILYHIEKLKQLIKYLYECFDIYL